MIQQVLSTIGRPHQYIAVDQPDSVIGVGSNDSSVLPSTLLAFSSDKRHPLRWLIATWECARIFATQSNEGFILVLDEMHNIRNWRRIVKGLWDADRHRGIPLHVVLVCSAPLLMRIGSEEGLTGRFELIKMPHWSLSEMSAAFGVTLDEYIYFGGYPGANDLMGDERRWRKYVLHALIESSLEHDVLALSRIDKPALLRQLLSIGASLSGRLVSYTALLGRLKDAGNQTTLRRYLELLSKGGLLHGLSKYVGPYIRLRASPPRLQVLNNALMAVHSPHTFETAQSDRIQWGRMVESAVGAHLCNSDLFDIDVLYWRQGHLEVDFVIRFGCKLVGISVDSGHNLGQAQGLEAFQRSHEGSRLLTIGSGGMPLQEFFDTPILDLFATS